MICLKATIRLALGILGIFRMRLKITFGSKDHIILPEKKKDIKEQYI